MSKSADAKPSNVPTYGLCRIEDHRRALWRVSISRRGKVLGAEFPDHAHGGKQGAYKAALRHRDELLTQAAPITMREWAAKLRTNNTSGVCRVQLHRKLRDGSVSELNYWLATFNGVHSGRKGSRTFSVAKYGEQGAYERAVRARAELLDQLVDEDEPFLLQAPDRCVTLTRKAAASKARRAKREHR